MKEVNVEIRGLVGLLMDKLDPIMIKEPEPTFKKYTDEGLQARAEKSIYRNSNGLFIPERNVKKCLINGAKMGRITLGGKRNLWPFIEASVFVEPREIPLNKQEPDNYIEIAIRRKDGNVIVKRLPICLDWQLAFNLLIYDHEIVERVHEALIIAGISVGLCYARPEYGRFEVTKWEVKK
jgi:hypothetical protein